MYSEQLANRVRELIAATDNPVEEKKMFGKIAFMVNDKMCVTIGTDRIMVRLSPKDYEHTLELPGCTPMKKGQTAMSSFMYIEEELIDTTSKLKHWVDMALAYNNEAKAAPKRRKK